MQNWQFCLSMGNTQFWNSLLCTQCLKLVETRSFESCLYHEFQTHSPMYTQYITSFAHLLLQQKEAQVLWTAPYPVHSAITSSNTSILVDCWSMVQPSIKACKQITALQYSSDLVMYFLTM